MYPVCSEPKTKIRPIISIFTASDAELIAYGSLSLILQSIVMPAHAWATVSNGFCAGMGDGLGALINSTQVQ